MHCADLVERPDALVERPDALVERPDALVERLNSLVERLNSLVVRPDPSGRTPQLPGCATRPFRSNASTPWLCDPTLQVERLNPLVE
jgi:hypothetical protein